MFQFTSCFPSGIYNQCFINKGTLSLLIISADDLNNIKDNNWINNPGIINHDIDDISHDNRIQREQTAN